MPIPLPANAYKVYEGGRISVYAWDQILFDGNTKTFECAVRPDSICTIPFVDENTVLLTKQRQPQRAEPFFVFPGGCVDPGESLEQAAKRELNEETGKDAKRIMEWSRGFHQGLVWFEEAVFVGTDLKKYIGSAHPDTGEHIELFETSWNELVALCLAGQIRGDYPMRTILSMEYDPESRRRLHQFLSDNA